MDLVQEKLAFRIRPEYQEIDYKDVYAEPLPLTMDILESSLDALEMYMHSLPQNL